MNWWRSRHAYRKYNIRKLASYRNKHRGETCVIIGNGPSLNETDLGLLKDHFTFGLNRIYLKFPELGFQTSCLVCINQLVIEQFGKDMLALDIPLFLDSRGTRFVKPTPKTCLLATSGMGTWFSTDAPRGYCTGSTVTYAAMQLAYFMGFSKVILVGVDHHFESKGPPNTTVTTEQSDDNHFAPDYFGKGVKWQLPDLEASEIAYRLANQVFKADGRTIFDSTVNGKLTVFPKIPLEQALATGR